MTPVVSSSIFVRISSSILSKAKTSSNAVALPERDTSSSDSCAGTAGLTAATWPLFSADGRAPKPGGRESGGRTTTSNSSGEDFSVPIAWRKSEQPVRPAISNKADANAKLEDELILRMGIPF